MRQTWVCTAGWDEKVTSDYFVSVLEATGIGG